MMLTPSLIPVSNGSPGVGSDYYSSAPYSQYSNTYGVTYNYANPAPAPASGPGLLSK